MRNAGVLQRGYLFFTCAVLLVVACPASAGEGQAVEVPGIVRIESNVPVSPPGWAALERRLLDTLGEAASKYVESFYNLPLLYALGGDDRLREISFREWDATARQLTLDFHVLHNEFAEHGDWFHIGEGIQYFYLLALADPTDHEIAARARRFAGLYMSEEPEAQNYDAKRKLIRSPHTGSLGPLFGDPEKAAPYGWSKGMATYGLPLEDVPGITTMEDLKDAEKARRMGRAMAERMERGDVPVNLAAASLVAHAYLFTGERKYADWVKEYVEAWLERTRQNGGITPDNVGLEGIAGEYMNGKWWGGLYGWHWPHGYYSVGMALQIGAASAMLVSGGDRHYLELPRSNMDRLIAMGKTVNGAFLVPYKKGDRGWFAFQPIDRSLPASLWFLSLDPSDWQRLRRRTLPIRIGDTRRFPSRARIVGTATWKAWPIGTSWPTFATRKIAATRARGFAFWREPILTTRRRF